MTRKTKKKTDLLHNQSLTNLNKSKETIGPVCFETDCKFIDDEGCQNDCLAALNFPKK